MKFPLSYQGRRFFFFTFVVEKRAPILSQLLRGEKRPKLTERGERIVALWKRLHEICSYFTPSDFVIMPDHIHLLLIVNSPVAFHFSPAVFAHWFQNMTEDKDYSCAACEPQPTSWEYIDFTSPKQPSLNPCADTVIPWAKDFWINISFDARQLSAIRRYIKMNPVRYFWKHDHPNLFRLINPLRHPILDSSLPWSAIGDITILASPFLYLVRLTRKKSLSELELKFNTILTSHKRAGFLCAASFLLASVNSEDD